MKIVNNLLSSRTHIRDRFREALRWNDKPQKREEWWNGMRAEIHDLKQAHSGHCHFLTRTYMRTKRIHMLCILTTHAEDLMARTRSSLSRFLTRENRFVCFRIACERIHVFLYAKSFVSVSMSVSISLSRSHSEDSVGAESPLMRVGTVKEKPSP